MIQKEEAELGLGVNDGDFLFEAVEIFEKIVATEDEMAPMKERIKDLKERLKTELDGVPSGVYIINGRPYKVISNAKMQLGTPRQQAVCLLKRARVEIV